MARLDVEHVSKHFGGVYALRDVSLHCQSGEIVGLIGPNGAGKTTLLNVISAALPVDEGTVSVDGRRIDGTGPRNCALIGIGRTFQNIRLFGRLTVHQNVAVAHATALAHRRARLNDVTVAGLLDFMGLSAHRHRRARELPYGLQRRLEIARALALAPEFLLLDEPAAGMNEAESEGLIGSVRAVRDRTGCGIIVIDHVLRFILTVCEHIHVMHMGELIAHGPPEEIQKDPRVIEVYIGGRGRAKSRKRRSAPAAEAAAAP
jgi:branched-chain amino acid transport system ATP-binding protein